MALNGWKYRKTLTIPSGTVSNDVTNFAYLVYLDSSNFDFSKAKSDGSDIVFTDTNDNVLNFFREKHDSTNQVAIYHVKIPTVSANSDTTIYMYYGNSSATDQATTYANVFENQIAYYNLDGNVNDLSGNYNGVLHGTTGYSTGILGQSFYGGATRQNGAELGLFNYNVPFSISFWIKKGNYMFYVGNGVNYYGNDTCAFTDSSFWMFRYNNTDANQPGSTDYAIQIDVSSVDFSTFRHIVVTVNYPNVVIYVDGVSTFTGTMAFNVGPSNYTTRLNYTNHTDSTEGYYDQIRFYNTDITADQITLLYKMETKNLFVFGNEISLSGFISTSWKYYSKITIDNTQNTNDLTDYQVKIDLTSNNFDFTKANSDGSDIRFTDSDRSTLLSYWIENWDSSNQVATIWVKVPSIAASSTKDIYMFYGNAGATSESSGDSTFELFDDFDETELNSNKWSLPAGSVSLSNSSITISGTGGRILSSNIFNQPLRVRSKAKYTDTQQYHHGYIAFLTSSDFVWDTDDSGNEITTGSGYFIDIDSNAYSFIQALAKLVSGNISPTYVDGSVSGDSTLYHLWEICNYNGDIKQNYDNGIEILSLTDTDYNSGYIVLGRRRADSLVVDWVFVSNYTSPEPTIIVGNTQANNNVTLFLANNF